MIQGVVYSEAGDCREGGGVLMICPQLIASFMMQEHT